MKINIYYGGRGLIEDPTIYVMNKLTEVLDELRVDVVRYNLYEDKKGISVLPSTLKDVDGVILASSLEWMGIGGLMQQFLDACWMYGNKDKLSAIYMLPVVIATAYGEREAQSSLIHAWELLGGIAVDGICAYVEDHVEFETDTGFAFKIEKSAEMLYRNISQKSVPFPSSFKALKSRVLKRNSIELTPQESEQLSKYVSNDTYVRKQKEDIEELAQIFKGMLGESGTEERYIIDLKKHFKPLDDFAAVYRIGLTDLNKTLIVQVNQDQLNCYYGEYDNPDVMVKTKSVLIEDIIMGKKTFQSAFMSGDLTAQGNFKILRTFDTIFRFMD